MYIITNWMYESEMIVFPVPGTLLMDHMALAREGLNFVVEKDVKPTF